MQDEHIGNSLKEDIQYLKLSLDKNEQRYARKKTAISFVSTGALVLGTVTSFIFKNNQFFDLFMLLGFVVDAKIFVGIIGLQHIIESSRKKYTNMCSQFSKKKAQIHQEKLIQFINSLSLNEINLIINLIVNQDGLAQEDKIIYDNYIRFANYLLNNNYTDLLLAIRYSKLSADEGSSLVVGRSRIRLKKDT